MRKILHMGDVAETLNTSIDTLRWWRHAGQGPPSFRIGRRVCYFADELEAWIEDQAAVDA